MTGWGISIEKNTDNPNRCAFGNRFKAPKVIELAGFSPDIYLDVKERNEYFTYINY